MNKKRGGLFLLVVCLLFLEIRAQMISDSIKQGEVVWKFSEPRPVGQFASGDWWVVAPVTITKILPEYKKIRDSVSVSSKTILLTFYVNGWEVNPVANQYKQGFDGALYYDPTDPSKSYFDSTLVPKLPYTITIGAVDSSGGAVSIVKAVSSLEKGKEKNYLSERRIKSAKVLTVVSKIPEGNGANLFRPPYVRGEKPFYKVDSIRWERLPSYRSPVSNPPSLDSIVSLFSKVGLAHTKAVRYMLPIDAYTNDYQPANCPSINEALLRLMLNDKKEDKKPALIAVLQRGIDIIHWQILGNVYPESGHQPGWLAIPSFTAALLNIEKYAKFVKTLPIKLGSNRYSRENFHEDCMLHLSSWNPEIVLWGIPEGEDRYWDYILKGNANRSILDPYGYIDGGKNPETYSYQLICINGYKGEVLCAHLMPAMREVWYDSVYIKLTKYVDRMVQIGKWTQPDICAPAEGVWRGKGPKNGKRCTSAMKSPVDGDTCILSDSNYKKTFGPDPNNPGKCICDKDSSDGIGRFPWAHGSKDGWQYRSAFVDTMWSVYRKGGGAVKEKKIGYFSGQKSFEVYYNPFNYKTLIKYNSSSPNDKMVLKIYDIFGREISKLVKKIEKNESSHIEVSTERFSSGIYFYRLSGRKIENMSVRKTVVVK